MGCGCNQGQNKREPQTNSPAFVNLDNQPTVSLPLDQTDSPLGKIAKKLAAIGDGAKNLIKAGSEQTNLVKWIKDGVSGLIKCIEGVTIYSDQDILKNRETCRNCPYSTKDNMGKMTVNSQCMAPNPDNHNIPCGCFIVCKTQVDYCPLKKWDTIPLTIKKT